MRFPTWVAKADHRCMFSDETASQIVAHVAGVEEGWELVEE